MYRLINEQFYTRENGMSLCDFMQETVLHQRTLCHQGYAITQRHEALDYEKDSLVMACLSGSTRKTGLESKNLFVNQTCCLCAIVYT